MKHSTEYRATISDVKRGLRAINCSQNRGAVATDQSPALVSMVLGKKAKSQPCLDKLAAFINRELAALAPSLVKAS